MLVATKDEAKRDFPGVLARAATPPPMRDKMRKMSGATMTSPILTEEVEQFPLFVLDLD